MISRIEEAVKANPDRLAYIHNNESITYKKLWERVCETAQYIEKQSSGPVIVYGHKSVDMIVAMLSCLKAKRAYVPVDVSMPISRLRDIIGMSDASLLIACEPVCIDTIEVCGLGELSKYSSLEPNRQTGDAAYIIFTSGSSGKAKGVKVSDKNLNSFVRWITALNPLCEYKNVNVLNQASFSFDLSVADMYYSLCGGHTLVALDKAAQEDYNEMFRIMKDNQISVCVMTPTFMKLCLLNKDFCAENFPELKCIYFCGEKLEAGLVKRLFLAFPKIRVINAYGPTEAASAVCGVEILKDDIDEGKLLPVGKKCDFACDIAVENGEIVIKGDSVACYLGDIKGGFYKENGVNCYKTGDMGYFENDFLYCSGRIDEQIKYKGYRIELGDIESNLKNIDGVLDAAVVTKCDQNNTVKSLKAFVVIDKDQSVETVSVKLREKLPTYMIPKQIKAIDSLPINANKKLDRKRLSEL